MKCALLASLLILIPFAGLPGADRGSPAEYVGGTRPDIPVRSDGSLVVNQSEFLLFQTRQATIRIPYSDINQVEYGQHVSRRYLSAVLISPMFLLAKKRNHFLTIGYQDASGAQQALVFQVEKSHVRPVLVSIEAKTGRKVAYQDDEARKAGRG